MEKKIIKSIVSYFKYLGIILAAIGYLFCCCASLGEMAEMNGTPVFLFPYFFTTVTFGIPILGVPAILTFQKIKHL